MDKYLISNIWCIWIHWLEEVTTISHNIQYFLGFSLIIHLLLLIYQIHHHSVIYLGQWELRVEIDWINSSRDIMNGMTHQGKLLRTCTELTIQVLWLSFHISLEWSLSLNNFFRYKWDNSLFFTSSFFLYLCFQRGTKLPSLGLTVLSIGRCHSPSSERTFWTILPSPDWFPANGRQFEGRGSVLEIEWDCSRTCKSCGSISPLVPIPSLQKISELLPFPLSYLY